MKLLYSSVHTDKKREEQNYSVLYQLLAEREPYVNISHKKMPLWSEHVNFIKSKPYLYWKVVYDGETAIGSYYITKNWEIGLFILKEYRGKGYGRNIIEWVKALYKTNLTANIAPRNWRSQALFEKLGFKPIQIVYKFTRS